MWTYQTTKAATETLSRSSRTSAGSIVDQSLMTFSLDVGTATQRESFTSFSSARWDMTSTQGAYGAMSQYAETLVTAWTDSVLIPGGYLVDQRESNWTSRVEWGFTSSATYFSTSWLLFQDNDGATFTDSSSETASTLATTSRTLASHLSSTDTAAATVTAEGTTTVTTTRTVHSASSLGTTQATETFTQTTSTTRTSAITSTGYATAASTTLSAPVAIVRISEMEPAEQGWHVTTPPVWAGYASELASTWSKRSGTWNAIAETLPSSSLATYTHTHLATGTETLTLTTSYQSTATHTHTHHASVIPATATTTRTLAVASTSTLTTTRHRWTATATSTHTGIASLHPTQSSTVTVLSSSSLGFTYNTGPSATGTAPLAITWTTTSALAARRTAVPFATTGTTAFSIGNTSSSSTATTIASTGTETVTTTATITTGTATTYSLVSSTAFTDPHLATDAHSETSSHTVIVGADTTEYWLDTITHAGGQTFHSVTFETWHSITAPLTATSTGTATSTSTTSATTTAQLNGGFTQGYSATQTMGISITYPSLHGSAIAPASVSLTYHEHTAAEGFRAPDRLASTDALARDLSLAGGVSLFYPWWATQEGAAGPATPRLYTVPRAYATGGTDFTVQWQESLSSLDITTRSGTGTTTASTRAGFTTGASATWFGHRSATNGPAGSSCGGVPARAEFRAAGFFPPGVRHLTEQTAGTASASSTSWLVNAELRSATNVGAAFPTRTETAYSLTRSETSWSMFDAMANPAGTPPFVPTLDLASLTPAAGTHFPATFSLSKHPAL